MHSWRPDFLSLSPIFKVLTSAGYDFTSSETFPDLGALNALALKRCLTNSSGLPLRFVLTGAKLRGRARQRAIRVPSLGYEDRIAQTGEVPTRASSWHDFFNALIWATFPLSKAALNNRQLTVRAPNVVRTREQDRLAIFDEGGIIFIEGTPSSSPRHLAFGHALYESIVLNAQHPPPVIHGMLLPVPLPSHAKLTVPTAGNDGHSANDASGVQSINFDAATAEIDRALANLILGGVFADTTRRFDSLPLTSLLT